MPDRLEAEAGHVERRLAHVEAARARAAHERGRERRDHVGGRHHAQRGGEVGYAERGATLKAERAQRSADGPLGLAPERVDDDVRELDEAAEREALPAQRVASAQDRDEALLQHGRAREAGRLARHGRHEEEIEPARRELREDVAARGLEREVDARREAAHAQRELERDATERVLGRGEPDGAARGGRLEGGLNAEDGAEPVEGAGERGRQRGGARGEQRVAARGDEERIVEELAELAEAAAHRGLGDAHASRGARDTLLGQEPVEREQEVEVDRLETSGGGDLGSMRGMHDDRFYLCT